MARTVRSDACLAATILGLGLLLVYVGGTLLDQWRSADHRHQNFSFEDLLGFAANGAGVALVAWWALSLLLAVFASLLHASGRKRGANALAKFSPAFMLRIAAAVVSLNLLGITMAQASPSPDPGWGPAPAGVGTSPHPAWTPEPVAGPALSSQRSVAGSPAVAGDPRWKPKTPATDPGLLSRPSSRQQISPDEAGVVVKAGDSLWSLAASRLGPYATDVEVALMWPKWYAANLTIIGGDPSVLTPGQILRPPVPG
ncbi:MULTISPECIES: hypothetical protein [unclassified Arthrobacter]|uniref:LysM peptidoglycan-binding domain-containing protein n=1 Tax=unclassified Arthrobacter TaxID=235627 RepID=UPI0028831967|nr:MULTISPECIES: hypothetical protein [unclassified Arthrobacter]